MPMGEFESVPAGLERVLLSLEELAQACAVEVQWVHTLVREGLLASCAEEPSGPRFDALALRRLARMRELRRAFEASDELAALVADLLEELDELRARLRRLGAG